jgi:hypothetical protein
MHAWGSPRAGALLALTVSAAVLSAGCVAQDRPIEVTYSVVADAGASAVATVGDTVHFQWSENRTLEAKNGGEVNEAVAYAWSASTGAHGNTSSFAVTPAESGLAIVVLNVTAKEHTASDAAAVLAIPAASPPGGRVYLASLGNLQLDPDAIFAPSHHPTEFSLFTGDTGDYPLSPVANQVFRISFPDQASDAAGSILFAVKATSNQTRTHASPPLAFDASRAYTLVIDTSPQQNHRLVARDLAGALLDNSSLADFETAHAGAAEVKVLVPPPASKLPGFGGAAAAGAVFVAALALTLRRRR